MKRIVMFSESDSDSEFRHVDTGTPMVKRKKRSKKDTDHSNEDSLKEGDKVQLSIVESLRKACDKENAAKKKTGNTLHNYFNAFGGSKPDVSRKKVSVDEFFSSSSLGKKRVHIV
ncbi:unnamed protein product [Dicrocoelium dendriticum]|nr:unnamed protein product [Dicrocoelium dendriticum]